VKLRSLAELGEQWRSLSAARQQAERAALERKVRERERESRLHAHKDLFARSVGPVHAVRDRGLAHVKRPLPDPYPHQREADERSAVRESLSDEVTLESLLLTDDGLSFRRPGMGPDVVTGLRRGRWAIQGELDLHGMTREEARDALVACLREAHRRGNRCLRIVHGKGLGSPGRQSVLKDKVQRWLAQRDEVIAFAQATGPQGGAGALIVLLAGAARR
jgi:DNA-nicking Smr family endonuclease